jgi:hypothetical protein
MSEWKRWREDPDAPSELRALFADGAGPRGMSAEERARARSRATAIMGAGAAGFFATSAWGRALASGKLMSIAAMVTVASATTMILTSRSQTPASSAHAILPLGGAHALGGSIASRGRTRPTPPPRADESPSLAMAPADPNPSSIAVPNAVASTASAHARRTAHQSVAMAPHTSPAEAASEVDPLVRESELVQAAMRALASDPSNALRLADRHAREFPNGQLVAERAYVRVRALARLGRTDEAVREAVALIDAHPESEYAARLSRALESGGGLR